MMNREAGGGESIEANQSQSAESVWERWSQAIGSWLPYVTLALATVLSLVLTEMSWAESGGTIALATLAAVWVFGMHTCAPEPRHAHRARMVVYFAGLLAFASILLTRHSIFFVFMITGFFHASDLKPWPLAVAGVAATSILVNTMITGFPWPTLEGWFFFITIIVIQTLAIGFGTLISEKITRLSEQRRQAVTRLEAALEENAGLQAQLLTQAREAGILEERQRMAREIHDTLAQGLIGIITQLEAVKQTRDRTDDWQRHLENAARLARESLSEARRSVQASRPEQLEGARLPDALAEVARQWSELNGVQVEVTTTGEPLPLHPEIEVTLLRTAQEALANIAKHANASRAWLTLSYMGDVVTLDVCDNGIGFEVPAGDSAREGGFGLTMMRQRVSRMAGTLEIESEPGGGTAISARVPAIPALAEALET